jgi:hypothetical protein
MIWTWLAGVRKNAAWCLAYVLWFLLPPSAGLQRPGRAKPKVLIPIDKNAPCPACGFCGSTLKCVVNTEEVVSHERQPIGGSTEEALRKVAVQRTCDQCGAKCYEPTVYETLTGKRPEVTV